MKKLTILVDMDDTIENLTDAWIDWLNRKHGTEVRRRDITSWDFAKAFPTLSEEEAYAPLYIDDFWDTVEPMEGAYEALTKLQEDGHEIFIVTSSAYETIHAKMTKVLFKYFPFISWSHVIVATRKQMVHGDVLIDDAPHNLEDFPGERILMNAPHNRFYPAEEHDMIRVDNWSQILSLVDRIAMN